MHRCTVQPKNFLERAGKACLNQATLSNDLLTVYVIYLALSEGLEDLGNVGGEAHVDEHHL